MKLILIAVAAIAFAAAALPAAEKRFLIATGPGSGDGLTEGEFTLLDSGEPAPQDTRVAVRYTDAALLIDFSCAESAMDSVKTSKTTRDDAELWQDDSVGIFLSPDPAKGYIHLMITPAGVILDEKSSPGGKRDRSFDIAGLQLSMSRGEAGWGASVTIPYAGLGCGPPQSGSEWGFNATRSQPGPSINSSWSPLSMGTFHAPTEFGVLRFDAGAAP